MGATEKAYERRWWILAVLCLSLVVITLDNTILNVALPTLVEKLHATNSQLQWIVDGYTLVFAVGFTTAAFYGWFPLFLPELFPTRMRATGQGVCFNAGRVFAAVGAVLHGRSPL